MAKMPAMVPKKKKDEEDVDQVERGDLTAGEEDEDEEPTPTSAPAAQQQQADPSPAKSSSKKKDKEETKSSSKLEVIVGSFLVWGGEGA